MKKSEYDERQDAEIASNTEALREQAECLRELRDHFIPEEESLLKRIYRKNPDAARTCYERDFLVAKMWFDKALALDDKFDEAYEGKAALLAALGQREEAIAAIDRAIEFCEHLPDYYYVKKGQILKHFEDWKGALAAFTKARELSPKNAEAWQEESLAAEKLGDAARAQTARRQAQELGSGQDTEKE